jgi:predicted DNA-binding protein (MmcQ/YjbR family)
LINYYDKSCPETIIWNDNGVMELESIRKFCLRLPHVTEKVQWGDHLVFKVGDKMFLVASLEPSKHALSLKVGAEAFEQLQEVDGIVPAPYLARAKWLALREFGLLRDDEMRELIRTAHALVFGSLPRSLREALTSSKPAKIKPSKPSGLSSRSSRKLD